MEMTKKTKNIINGLVIGTMVFSMASMVFAEENTEKAKSEGRTRAGFEQMQEKSESIWKQIVEKGIITQEQGDKIMEKMKSHKEGFGLSEGQGQPMTEEERKAKLAEKVASGALTQEQADKMLERMANRPALDKEAKEPMSEEEKQAKLVEKKAKLEEKITSGELTQEQIDKMKEKMTNRPAFNKEDRQPMTEEEKQEKLEERKAKLAEKVASGELTQEQADKMLQGPEKRNGGRGLENMLSCLVEEGILTQEQVTQIGEFFKAAE